MGRLLGAVLPAAALMPVASTFVAVALPAIMAELDIGTAAIWWLVTGYLLVSAVLQVPLGRLADRVGPRRLLLGGAGILAAASGGAAVAPGAAALVVARITQGVAGAAVVPSALALLRRRLPDEATRGRAVGAFMATMAAGGLVGVSLGGAVVAAAGWRAAFWGIALLALLALPPGIVLSPAGSGARRSGRSEPRSAPAAATVDDESRRHAVLAPAAGIALVSLTFYVVLLVVPLRLDAAGLSSLVSGSVLGAFVLAAAGGALSAARVQRWLGAGRTILLLNVAAGVALLALVVLPTAPVWLVTGLVVAGAGGGVTLSSAFAGGLGAAPEARAGARSGLLSTSRYAGSIVGTAALPPLLDTAGTGAGLVLAAGASLVLVALLAFRRGW